MDDIVIFRKGPIPPLMVPTEKDPKKLRKATSKDIDHFIFDLVDSGRVRILREQTIRALFDGTIAKLPQVGQSEIDATNGPRKLAGEGKAWTVPVEELGRKQKSDDSTVISIKRYIQNALGIDPALFSVCRVHGRTVETL